MNWTIEDMNKALEEVYQKAKVNQEFQTLCLKNPIKAVEEISGKTVPQGIKIHFVENIVAHITQVFPNNISPSSEELSESDLEQVSAAGNPYRMCPNCGSTVKSRDLYMDWRRGVSRCINCVGR